MKTLRIILKVIVIAVEVFKRLKKERDKDDPESGFLLVSLKKERR